MAKQKTGGLFGKIQTREDALKVAKDCGNVFLLLAALQGAGAFILDNSLLIDAVLIAICGVFIRWKQSRAASIVVLLLAAVGLVTTFLNLLGQGVGGGGNILLALIAAWIAIRAVQATFKLHGRFKATAGTPAEGKLT